MESFICDPKTKRLPQLDFVHAGNYQELTHQLNTRLRELVAVGGVIKQVRHQPNIPTAVVFYEGLRSDTAPARS